MSNFASNTTETSYSTDDDGEPCEVLNNQEWVKFSTKTICELSSDCETFLNVQVPSCQNFALGDSQRKFEQKMEILAESKSFSRSTHNITQENSLPRAEDETEPFSVNKKNLPECKPVFSEFIEELLFESTPLYDEGGDDGDILTDTELFGAESDRFSKTAIDSKNISGTLKTLIENLEGLKSLTVNSKSSSTVPSRSQQRPVAASRRQLCSTNPMLEMACSSMKLPSSFQLDESTQPMWSSAMCQDFQEPECSDGITASSLIAESSLKPVEPSDMLPMPMPADCNTSPHSPETMLMTQIVTGLPAEDTLMEQSQESVAEPAVFQQPLDLEKPADAEPSTRESSSIQLTASPPMHQSSSLLESHSHADDPSSLPESSNGTKCLINLGVTCDQSIRFVASHFGLEHSSDTWDLLWVNRDPSFSKQEVIHSIEMYKNLKSYQRVNHFPGSWGLGLKDLLAKNLNYMNKYFPGEYDFFPKTWILPTQSLDLKKYISHRPDTYFVIKPTYPSSGYETKITNDIHESEPNCENVCQLYLNPFLIDGYKFDFRVYVLVTSCDPLRIYVHSEGFARFATKKYEEPADVNSKDIFMHFTNTGANVRSPSYVQDEFCGSLRRISTVFQWLRSSNFNVEKIKASMDDAIIKTIIANLATLRDYYQICFPCHAFSSACFEILGFDVLLDDQLKLNLLDVDCSPSFDCEGGDPFEAEMKTAILSDVFSILNLAESRRNRVSNKENPRRETLLERLLRRKEEISAAQSQMEWEDSHLGGFRKIYPPEDRCKDKYFQNLIDTALRNPNIV